MLSPFQLYVCPQTAKADCTRNEVPPTWAPAARGYCSHRCCLALRIQLSCIQPELSSEGRPPSFAGKAQLCPLTHAEVLMLEEALGQGRAILAQASALTSVAGLAVF